MLTSQIPRQKTPGKALYLCAVSSIVLTSTKVSNIFPRPWSSLCRNWFRAYSRQHNHPLHWQGSLGILFRHCGALGIFYISLDHHSGISHEEKDAFFHRKICSRIKRFGSRFGDQPCCGIPHEIQVLVLFLEPIEHLLASAKRKWEPAEKADQRLELDSFGHQLWFQ